jgi:transcriptional regulator with XRE-family HTH domain
MTAKSTSLVDRHVADRVRMQRMTVGMTQVKLGAALGVTFQQVQKYEKGSNRIGAGRLQQIAHLLQVPVAFFFEGAPGHGGSSQNSRSSPDYTRDFATSEEGQALAKAFQKITDVKLRRRIVALVERLAAL